LCRREKIKEKPTANEIESQLREVLLSEKKEAPVRHHRGFRKESLTQN
jgi:hypothetical protein